LAQRPHKGLLGGLWEFPGGKLEPDDADLPACLGREIKEELGIEIAVGGAITAVKHAYTHFRITLHAFHARHVRGEPQTIGCADWRWVRLEEVAAYPLAVTDQKILAALGPPGEVSD
jgi:A/G-specific adenine glycosylase